MARKQAAKRRGRGRRPVDRPAASYTPDELQHAVIVPDDAEGHGDVRAAALESAKRHRGPQKAPTKESVTIR
jgi:hypothetical protein